MQAGIATTQTLILGLGNILLSDDGVGIHVVRALEGRVGDAAALRDGGTIGMALLSEIEQFGAVIAIDAMEFGGAPGDVRAFQGPDMDRQLCGKKRTAHEVALADLIQAAELAGCLPPRRALVAIQPESTAWGLAPTEAVAGAIAKACEAVLSLIGEWNDGR